MKTWYYYSLIGLVMTCFITAMEKDEPTQDIGSVTIIGRSPSTLEQQSLEQALIMLFTNQVTFKRDSNGFVHIFTTVEPIKEKMFNRAMSDAFMKLKIKNRDQAQFLAKMILKGRLNRNNIDAKGKSLSDAIDPTIYKKIDTFINDKNFILGQILRGQATLSAVRLVVTPALFKEIENELRGIILNDVLYHYGKKVSIDKDTFAATTIIENILQAGFSPFVRKDDFTLLHFAAAGNNVQLIDMLLKMKLNINDHQNEHNDTPLLTAVIFGQVDAVLALLKHGADSHIKTADGETVLEQAEYNVSRFEQELNDVKTKLQQDPKNKKLQNEVKRLEDLILDHKDIQRFLVEYQNKK